MSGIRAGIVRYAVTVFAATATLLFQVGVHVGHETVIYEVGRAVGQVGLGGLRTIRPMVRAVAADSEMPLLQLLLR